MALISKIYKYERPLSISDSNYEEFQYLLAWHGRDGSFLQRMFLDWEFVSKTKVEILNISDEDKIKTFINSEDRGIRLFAENFTFNDIIAMSSILVTPKIIKVNSDAQIAAGSDIFERVTIDANSFEYKKTDLRYNLSFSIMLSEKPLAR